MKIAASLALVFAATLSAQHASPFTALSDTGSMIRMTPSLTALRAAGASCTSLFAPQQSGTSVYPAPTGKGQLIDHGGFELPLVGFQQIYYSASTANSTATSLGYPTVKSQIGAFISAFADNTNWSGSPTDDYTIIQQYGSRLPIANSITNNPANLVSPGTPFVDVQTPTSRITDSQIQTYLVSLFASGKVHAASNIVYGVYFPSGMTINSGLATSCTTFCGYHSHFAYGTVQVVYAVFPYPDCTGCSISGLAAADILSIVTSHELRESVTNPGTLNMGAWYDSAGYEADDKCAWCNLYQTANGQFWVQPEFSNGGTVSNSGFTATYPQLSPGVGGCVVPNNLPLPPN